MTYTCIFVSDKFESTLLRIERLRSLVGFVEDTLMPKSQINRAPSDLRIFYPPAVSTISLTSDDFKSVCLRGHE